MTPERRKELGGLVLKIANDFEIQHQEIREDQLTRAKKGELFFKGKQHVFMDYSLGSLRDAGSLHSSLPEDALEDAYYSKVANVYRAHGESVIAALSAETPKVLFFPDDPQDSDSIETAKNFTNLGILVQRHNRAELLQIRALALLWKQGFVAGYNYEKEDKKFGTYSIPIEKMTEVDVTKRECPNCGADIPDNAKQVTRLEFLGSEEGSTEVIKTVCSNCEQEVDPEEIHFKEQVKKLVGFQQAPKSRQIMDVFGVSHVKVSPYARTQAETPYLILEFEVDPSWVRYKYKIDVEGRGSSISAIEAYTRDPEGYEELNPRVTMKFVWLRPEAFYTNSLEQGEELEKEYPNGLKFVYANDVLCETEHEDMDSRWVIMEIPTESHIHADSMGKPLEDVQEIENEALNLTLQLMEHGIPETFADPTVVDFDEYEKVESVPGLMFPAKRNSNERLEDAFFTTRTASISQEVGIFHDRLEKIGQMLTGAMPSVWGGLMSGGSRTAAEYDMSRKAALQRLQLAWKFMSIWYAQFVHNTVLSYAASLTKNPYATDENFSVKQGRSFVNLKVRRDTLKGKLGHVEPEASGAFPLSWTQKRDLLVELIGMNNPEIMAALLMPDNAQLLVELSGIPELKLPGAESRSKQYREIQQMIKPGSQPFEGPDGNLLPTVLVDPELDDHQAEAQVLKAFLISDYGLDLKEDDPAAYANCLAHLRMHMGLITEQTAQSRPNSPAGQAPESAATSVAT